MTNYIFSSAWTATGSTAHSITGTIVWRYPDDEPPAGVREPRRPSPDRDPAAAAKS